MTESKVKNIFIYSLFFGGLWGFAEATLGYLLHFITFIPGISAFVMFPIAFYFMNLAYKYSGSFSTIFATSAVAAFIKLFDLFLPLPHPIKAINPALSILFEGLAVYALYRITSKKMNFLDVYLTSVSWRTMFVMLWLVQLFIPVPHFLKLGFNYVMQFMLIDSLVNSVIIYACMKYVKPVEFKKLKLNISYSSIMVCIAILSEILLFGKK